ncbi:hypothetical protein LLE49_24705 [Alicyclobacillus tolerans]|uniref:hypothetical protein n=1 Tax=Alicyclobacillus tolerans TaxID=90970 RepID=UPI001F1921E0|nr:hypothetical protein [Alicyclobacillus tolerans]MCF8567928.1 hypothetical protein [Alicyclobacillus tolerans]
MMTKTTRVTSITLILVLALGGGFTAFEVIHAHSTSKPIHATDFAAPQQALPGGVEAHLSSYKTRLKQVSKLPLTIAQTSSGHARNIQGDVLYIDPSSAYAIQQFNSAWPRLQHKPTVVWVHTTPDNASKYWNLEGYKSDPLPSPSTLYTKMMVAEPDAYRAQSHKYLELPGVLRPNQTNYWVTFFNH